MYTIQDYEQFMAQVSSRVHRLSNYNSYANFENDWVNYYHTIYLPHANPKLPPRIFIAESAPDGVYPNNLNYIFAVNTLGNYVNTANDMYLYRYYRGVFPNINPNGVTQITKLQALVDLSQENILILDLLPTHGIKLNSNERRNIRQNLLGLLDFNFLNRLNFPNQQINYAFSVPPSLYQPNFCGIYLNPNFLEFGNVNSGQGHAPSIQAINQILKNGF